MPASVYSEPTFNNTDSDDSAYDFEDCASESDSLLGHTKLRSPPSSCQTAPVGSSVSAQLTRPTHKLQLEESVGCIGINQISPTSESVVTEQFEDARSLQSPGSFFSTSPPEGASPARFPVAEVGPREEDKVFMTRCVALYNFRAENPDELDMVNHEELELLGEGEDEGWVRVRNYKGDEGFVPRSYLELLLGKDSDRVFTETFMGQPILQPAPSFSSVDYLSCSDYNHLQSIPEGVTINFREPSPGQQRRNQIKYCKALYDFSGKTSTELSFRAGDIIRVVRTKTPAGGDDGWWEGELGGRAGLFPSLVVEPVLDTKLVPSLPVVPQEKLEIVETEAGGMSKPLSPVKLQFQRKSLLRSSPVNSRKTETEFPLFGASEANNIPKIKPPPPYSMVVTAPPPQIRSNIFIGNILSNISSFSNVESMTMTNAARNIPRTANMQTQLATRNTNSQQKKERWGGEGEILNCLRLLLSCSALKVRKTREEEGKDRRRRRTGRLRPPST